MDMRGALPELVHGQVYKRWLSASVGSSQLNWFALILYKELTGLALLKDTEEILLEPEAFSDIKIARLKKGVENEKTPPDPVVCKSSKDLHAVCLFAMSRRGDQIDDLFALPSHVECTILKIKTL